MLDEVFVVRASAYRIARLADAAAVIGEHDGWSRLDRDPRSTGAATRAFACVLRYGARLEVVTYSPDGSSRSSVDAWTLPGGDSLLRQALTYEDARYTRQARLADACRALGVPVELLVPTPSPAPAGARAPRTSVVLAGPEALGDAGLTGQSAWTVPLSPRWCLHFWDGAGRETTAVTAALVLGGKRPAVAWWWSADEAGLVVAHGSKAVGGHQWGGSAPVTGDSTAAVGRLLAADFGVPDQALAIVGLLRRTDLTPAGALASLAETLGLPAAGIGRATTASLVEWATGATGAVHTPAMTGMAAIRYAMRSTAMPPNRRVDGVIALVTGLATGGLALVWHGGGISGWWVLLGVLVTAGSAWGVRRRHPVRQ